MSLKAMGGTLFKERQGLLVELRCIQAEEKQEWRVLAALKGVVQSHLAIFESPKGLPPNRQKNHAIVLKEGTNPVSVQPYRYPQIQKDEIEKLVRDMLHAQIIRLSTSPFSSPVIL